MSEETLKQVTGADDEAQVDEQASGDESGAAGDTDELDSGEEDSGEEEPGEEDSGEEEPDEEVKALMTERDELKSGNESLQKKIDELQGGEVLKVAAGLGIMPELIGEREARGFGALSNARLQVKAIKRMVRRNEESYPVGKEDYTHAEMLDLLDQWEEKLEELDERWSGKLKQSKKDSAEVFRLGMQAKKAGWVPGKKVAAPKKSVKMKIKRKRTAGTAGKKTGADYGSVTNNDELVDIVAAQRAGK